MCYAEVVDQVPADEPAAHDRGGVVDWLVVVQASSEVFGAAAGVVRAPAVAVADSAVGHVGDVVVSDLSSRSVADENGDAGVECVGDVGEDVLRDRVIAIDHARVRRVVGVCLDASH